jgi:death-on-curing protein
MSGPIWALKKTVLAIHHRQLAEHGGPKGLRDEGLLDSALARPKNMMPLRGKALAGKKSKTCQVVLVLDNTAKKQDSP